jgi:bifunctional NMN adenylyltransferase/nudix hydrolase
MNKKYDYIVFILRGQPFHLEHAAVLQHAFELAYNVIVFVGSSNQPRTIKNPWTFAERKNMILEYFVGDNIKGKSSALNLHVLPLRDVKENDHLWAAQVTEGVSKIEEQDYTKDSKIGIIGHNKDDSSYYLKMFPQWTRIKHPMNENVSASDIRRVLFEGLSLKFIESVVPENVFRSMVDFVASDEYKKLVKQYNFIKNYKKGWEAAPYPVNLTTVDAVVVQSGHILLVKRKSEPGQGLMALPGGHLKTTERIVDGMMRELREETKLKVPDKVLRGSIKERQVFDDVERSLIGRVVTHAFLIELDAGELPPVKGSDDAMRVGTGWYPISDIESKIGEEGFFDDHYHIINKMLGKT